MSRPISADSLTKMLHGEACPPQAQCGG